MIEDQVFKFIGLIIATMGSAVGTALAIYKMFFKEQVSRYLDSDDGKIKIKSIIKDDCDSRHRIDKNSWEKSIDRLTEEIKNLYKLIKDTSDEILEIYKHRSL